MYFLLLNGYYIFDNDLDLCIYALLICIYSVDTLLYVCEEWLVGSYTKYVICLGPASWLVHLHTWQHRFVVPGIMQPRERPGGLRSGIT